MSVEVGNGLSALKSKLLNSIMLLNSLRESNKSCTISFVHLNLLTSPDLPLDAMLFRLYACSAFRKQLGCWAGPLELLLHESESARLPG